MGLNTTHGCWNGSYCSFSVFRKLLGKQIGIELDTFVGFGGTTPWSTVSHKIKPLLNHSDCDGILTIPQCEQIAIGLDEILNNFKPELVKNTEDIDYFKENIIQFRDGCLYAVSENEIVEFF